MHNTFGHITSEHKPEHHYPISFSQRELPLEYQVTYIAYTDITNPSLGTVCGFLRSEDLHVGLYQSSWLYTNCMSSDLHSPVIYYHTTVTVY